MIELPFERLLEALSKSEAFPEKPAAISCEQTHISAVFLLDDVVYKVKKPKKLPFLDFTTPERRRHFCHEEVRLNRRLAPDIYQGVAPIVVEGGVVRISPQIVESPTEEVSGEVVDWAVKMVRLPEDRTLGSLVEAEQIGSTEMSQLARQLARFHDLAERGEEISKAASWKAVSGIAIENLDQVRAFVGETISPEVFEKLYDLSQHELRVWRSTIDGRARGGAAREIHGDLRLEHVYLLPWGAAHGQDRGFIAIDCVEFNERFRWADPVADIAFLVMELEFIERSDLAVEFAREYFLAAEDPGGEQLLPFYSTYRDVVRGKVRSLQASEPLLERAAQERAAEKATKHFLQGLSRLSSPEDRPAIVVVQGLPGVGKSTIAKGLAESLGFRWIDTDRIRKALFGAVDQESGPDGFGQGMYSAEWTDRTYRECGVRARETAWRGGRVLIEGSFRREKHRASIRDVGRALGVSVVFLDCSVGREEARRRITERAPGPSDADWRVHLQMVSNWERPSAFTSRYTRGLSLDGDPADAIGRARTVLAQEGLA